MRDQHAAAVARLGAAAGLVVIGLRAPVRNDGRAADDLSEIAAFEDFAQLQARRTEAMLQHHAESHAGVATGFHHLLGAGGRNFQRLFQQHVLAGFGGGENEIAMRIRRRQDRDAIDALVREDRVEIAGDRKLVFVRKRLAARFGRAVGRRDLDAILQIDEALGMRSDRHAKADDRHAMPCHALKSVKPRGIVDQDFLADRLIRHPVEQHVEHRGVVGLDAAGRIGHRPVRRPHHALGRGLHEASSRARRRRRNRAGLFSRSRRGRRASDRCGRFPAGAGSPSRRDDRRHRLQKFSGMIDDERAGQSFHAVFVIREVCGHRAAD